MRFKLIFAGAAIATLVGTGMAVVPVLTPAIAAADQARQDKHIKAATCALKITGMTCSGCTVAVTMAATKVDGVFEANVSLADASAEVTYNPAKTTPEKIAKAITENSGFKAEAPGTCREPAARNPSAAETRSSTRQLKVEGLPLRGTHY